MRFLKVSVFVSTKTKKDIFVHISDFGLFSPVQTESFSHENADLDTFSPTVRTKMPENADRKDAFFCTVFKSRFDLSTLGTKRFQNDAFPKGPSFETVFENLRFHQRFWSL